MRGVFTRTRQGGVRRERTAIARAESGKTDRSSGLTKASAKRKGAGGASGRPPGPPVTYGDVDRLRTDLVSWSKSGARSDDAILRAANLGVPGFRDPMVAQCIATIASWLSHNSSEPIVHRLCRGALVSALHGDGRRRVLLPFAVRLIQQASASPLTSVSSPVSSLHKSLGAQILEYYSEVPAKVDHLTRAASDFTTQNAPLAGSLLFARMLADLEFLSGLLVSRDSTEEHRGIAFSALTHFAEFTDASADGLGMLGVLENAHVLQLAAESIEPVRRMKTALVDTLLGRWPFLASLRMSVEGKDWIPSEFFLVNAAIAFGGEQAAKTAIVLPSTDDMALFLGVLGGLGALYDALERRDVAFRPAVGDQICLGGDDTALCEVVRYLANASSDEEVEPSKARFVTLKYLPRSRRSSAAPVKDTRPINILDSCRPAPGERVRRRASLPPSARDAAIGPLEQLFSLDRPARFRRDARAIVIVSPSRPVRALLRSTMLFERSLGDLIPSAGVSREDDFSREWWSASQGLDAPVLTIARDLADAAAIVARSSAAIPPMVLTEIDSAEWDAASLRAVDGAVVAIIPQRRHETLRSLRADGFKVFDWTAKLTRALARRPNEPKPTAIGSYEMRVRRELLSEVRVHAVELDSIQTSFACLKELSRTTAAEYGEDTPDRLASWVQHASSLGFQLASEPVVVGDARASEFESKLGSLSERLQTDGRWWSEPSRGAARRYLDELRRTTADLRHTNPKAAVLSELVVMESLTVRCSDRAWECLQAEHPRAARWSRDIGPGPVALFEWLGPERIGQLLFPPLGDPTHVVFYRWERERLETIRRRREAQLDAHWSDGVRPVGWHLDHVAPGTPSYESHSESAGAVPTVDLDEWLGRLQRHRVISHAAGPGVGEQVVDAVSVMFGGAKYAFYEPDDDVAVATHLLGEDARQRDEAVLRKKAARQLQPGDLVVNVQGSSRDAIRELADKNLPPGARELARAWHRPLRELRARAGSDHAVWQQLRTAGCTKQEATIQEWLRSRSQIGPSDDEDLDAIARASEDAQLAAKLAACKEAIRRVRGEHIRASQALAARAIEALARKLLNGDELGASVALGDQVEILCVEMVGEALVRVGASLTGIVEVLG